MFKRSGFTFERRRHTRTPAKIPVRCLRLDPDGRNIVDRLDTVDISRGGLGVTTESTYYPGQRVIVSLPLSETQGQRNLYARVVRCRPDRSDKRRSRLGLAFDSVSIDAWCGVRGVPAQLLAA